MLAKHLTILNQRRGQNYFRDSHVRVSSGEGVLYLGKFWERAVFHPREEFDFDIARFS